MSRLSEVEQAHEAGNVTILANTLKETQELPISAKETINTTAMMLISRELALLNQTMAIIADKLTEEDK